MVFNATFNNILDISLRAFFLVEETGKNTDLSQVTNKHYHMMLYRMHLAMSYISKIDTISGVAPFTPSRHGVHIAEFKKKLTNIFKKYKRVKKYKNQLYIYIYI